MIFSDWYNVEKNSNILVLDKDCYDLNKYKNKKYDYIYLNGTIENAKRIINTDNYLYDFLSFFKSILKPGGSLFIATDNRLGVKYIVGDKCKCCENIYDSLKNRFKDGKLYSKAELDYILEEIGFTYTKYYYPLPNYETPNVIYTDKYLPNTNDSKVNYNFIYDENSLILQDELSLLKIFINENKFKEFTNSYIIQLSNAEISDDVKFYSFTPMRKDKYSLILKMRENYIEKIPLSKTAINHVAEINKNNILLKKLGFEIAEIEQENIIMSKFIKDTQLDKYVVDKITSNNIEDAMYIIDEWYKFINEKLQPNEKGIVKHGFIDMVFENTFYDIYNKKFIFFDQEWYEEDLEIKYIMYRALTNLYEHNSKISNYIEKSIFFEKYGINEKDFEEKEKEFQNKVIDVDKKSFYDNQYKYKTTPEEIKNIVIAVNKLDKDNVELIAGNKKLNDDNIQLLEGIKKLDRDNVDLINENERLKDMNNNLLRELNKYKQ